MNLISCRIIIKLLNLSFGSRYMDSCAKHGILPNTAILSGLFKVCVDYFPTEVVVI